MRIAIVANSMWYVANFRSNLISHLMRDGYDVKIIAPFDAYVSHLESLGVDPVSLRMSGSGTNPLREIGSLWSLIKKLKSNRIDVVFSFTPKANLYTGFACKYLGIQFVPNISGLGRLFLKTGFVSQLFLGLFAVSFSKARAVLFQNDDDMAFFVMKGIVPEKISARVPGSGVDLQKFSYSPVSTDEAKEIVFLLAARLIWEKGIREYIEAANYMMSKYPNVRFQVAGFLGVDSPSAVSVDDVDCWVSKGIVEYLGATDDIGSHIRKSTCIVLPSKYKEGVPRILLEAAAVGRPVITTNTSGCNEAVVDGETGFLCAPGDVDSLVACMEALVAMSFDELVAMGERARVLMESKFDERLVIDKYRSLARSFSEEYASR